MGNPCNRTGFGNFLHSNKRDKERCDQIMQQQNLQNVSDQLALNTLLANTEASKAQAELEYQQQETLKAYVPYVLAALFIVAMLIWYFKTSKT